MNPEPYDTKYQIDFDLPGGWLRTRVPPLPAWWCTNLSKKQLENASFIFPEGLTSQNKNEYLFWVASCFIVYYHGDEFQAHFSCGKISAMPIDDAKRFVVDYIGFVMANYQLHFGDMPCESSIRC